ncbi:MAG: Crp/Fnr family transcriptional regulator [Chitinophagales bacterium]
MNNDELVLIAKFTKAYSALSSSAIEQIAQIGHLETIPKKDHFISFGQLDKRLAFVIDGLFRGYILNDGEETTLWFSDEFDIIASYNGILFNETSKITYQALESSTLFVIHYDDLKNLAKNNQEVALTIIQILEQVLGEAFQRNERFILMDAETRYLNLLEKKPKVISRVPQKLLASYIGITPVSLSRLRSRLNKKRDLK